MGGDITLPRRGGLASQSMWYDPITSMFDNFGASYTMDAAGNKTGSGGWGSPLISGLGTAANAWLGMKGLGMAEESLDFQKDSFNRNFAMQQDQYYRSLNDKRILGNVSENMSTQDMANLRNHYDSGANLEGAYNPSATALTNQTRSDWNQPTIPSASGSGMAQVNPYSTASMLTNGSAAALGNIGRIAQANALDSNFSSPMQAKPVQAKPTGISNTNVGPDGKRRVKRTDNVGARTVNDTQ